MLQAESAHGCAEPCREIQPQQPARTDTETPRAVIEYSTVLPFVHHAGFGLV